MPKTAKSRKFASKAEEVAWWEANEGRLADEFEKIAAAGSVGPATFVITGDSTVAKVRLGKKDVELASKQAKERGMRCHDYLKFILHETRGKTESGAEPVAS